jgi:hypothetical protein
MAKYYIKIEDDKYIISHKNFASAIKQIINNNPYKYSKGAAVYISETGFSSSKNWSCFKIDQYLSN